MTESKYGHLLPVLISLAQAFFPPVFQAAEEEKLRENYAAAEFFTLPGDWNEECNKKILNVYESYVPQSASLKLSRILWLLQYPLGTLLLTGRYCISSKYPFIHSFPHLSVEIRQQILICWATSFIPEFRLIFLAVKFIIVSVLMGHEEPSGRPNPIWQALHYPGRELEKQPRLKEGAIKEEEKLAAGVTDLMTLTSLVPKDLQAYLRNRGFSCQAASEQDIKLCKPGPVTAVINCDVVVVGSGAGGGVVAAKLAKQGHRVVVVEKGMFRRMSDMTLSQTDSLYVYEQGNYCQADDLKVALFAGSVLGGGTKVNWSGSLPTPAHVRKEWSMPPHNLEHLMGEEYDAALAEVMRAMGVGDTKLKQHSGPNLALKAGLEALGEDTKVYPRNCSSEVCSAYCNMGCKWGHKASSDIAFLADAVHSGHTRVLVSAYAERIVTCKRTRSKVKSTEHSRQLEALGVIVSCTQRGVLGHVDPPASAAPLRIFIRAPVVVSSAGSIHTPALLLRSGIKGRGNVGKHLRLHPSTLICCRFPTPRPDQRVPEVLEAWGGPSMTIYTTKHANWDEDGYGPLLTLPAIHPVGAAMAVPWMSGEQYKRTLLDIPNTVMFLVITRDKNSGRVTLDSTNGAPYVEYTMSESDKRSMLKGMERCIRAAAAAGADRIYTLHQSGLDWERARDGVVGLQDFIRKLWQRGIPLFDITPLSAHQMCSARMGSSPKSSAVDCNGESWDVSGCYVADASVMPTCSGTNPMVTIMALSSLIAGRLCRRLKATSAQDGAARMAVRGTDSPRRRITVVYED